MFNVFFKDTNNKNDFEVVFGWDTAIERAKYYEELGYTNIRIGKR